MVQHARHSRHYRLRQRYVLYEFRVPGIMQALWYASHHFCTTSPFFNRTGRKSRTYSQSGLIRMGNGNIEHNLLRFLLVYRRTPHSTTGVSPSELLMNRKLKSRLDLIRPDINTTVTNKQHDQKNHHDLHVSHRTFVIGQQVYTLIYRHNKAT